MRRWRTWAPALALADGAASPFDGHWAITLICPRGPDGSQGFRFDFPGVIAGGVLHGEHGRAGQPGWLALDGPVQPGGDAQLTARGLAGQTAYNLGPVSEGVPYSHPVTAHFDGPHGEGQWSAPRTCDFTFRKA